MGYWNPNVLRVATLCVVPNEEQQENADDDDISKLLEDSCSNSDNAWQPQDTTMQQNNPQPIVPFVDEEDDISKLLEDSERGNSCPPDHSNMMQNNAQPQAFVVDLSSSTTPNIGKSSSVEEIQIEHNSSLPKITSKMQTQTQLQVSAIALSSSATHNNSVLNKAPSHQSLDSFRPPVEEIKLPNLAGLFYFGKGPLCRVDHVGICKVKDNSLWQINMDRELVRSTLGSSNFPSNLDKEMLDYVGNHGMLKSIFAILGHTIALSTRLMDWNSEIRSLENEVEVLQQKKQDVSNRMDMEDVEITCLRKQLKRHKDMSDLVNEKIEDIDGQYRAELQRLQKHECDKLKAVEEKLKEVEAELQATNKRAQSVEQMLNVAKKEVESVKEEAKTSKEVATIAKEEARAFKVLADAAEVRAKNAEDELCLVKTAKGKREAELIPELGEFSNIGKEVFEDGFQRALRQFKHHHPSIDISIFDMHK